MPLESQFSAGPRLTDVPGGDPATRAVASLRGYAYQLYVSGLAWLNVRADQYLYLEVAKDYAIVAADALRAIEVKDTPFASITINSEDVRDTLDHFVDLVERNPKRRVDLRFLCTGSCRRAQERGPCQRNGDAGLLASGSVRSRCRAAASGPIECEARASRTCVH
jgi:hypothetical protein